MRFLEAIEIMKKLKPDEISLVLIELFNAGKVDFIEVTQLYVKQLEKAKKLNNDSIASLGLMLATYCIHDKEPHGKTARQHLYESGAFGGENDGSSFGKQLDEEFKNEPKSNARKFNDGTL